MDQVSIKRKTFGSFEIETWNLFGIWDLSFRISTPFCVRSTQQDPGDDQPLYLIGPLNNLQQFGIPYEYLYGMVCGNTLSPQDLTGLIRHFGGRVRGQTLAHR